MDQAHVQQYRLIGAIQSHIATSQTLEGALQGMLRIIADTCGVDLAIIWYGDQEGARTLRPYF